jgi:hypothetical protein
MSTIVDVRRLKVNAVKTSPLELQFHLGEKEKNHGVQGPVSREVGDGCRIRRSQKLMHNERRVSRNFVSLPHDFM